MNTTDENIYEQVHQCNDMNQLRTFLAQIENEIKNIVGDEPYYFYHYPDKNGDKFERVQDLLSTRSSVLRHMFYHASPEEHARFIQVNDYLLQLTQRMYERLASHYRYWLGMKHEADEDSWIECSIKTYVDYCLGEPCTDVIQLDNDDYYGSDFTYMIALMYEYERYENGEFGESVLSNTIYCNTDDNPDMSDEQLQCANKMDDDMDSWAEGFHDIPALDDVYICYAVHSICTHHIYSAPDMLRMVTYTIDLKESSRYALYT